MNAPQPASRGCRLCSADKGYIYIYISAHYGVRRWPLSRPCCCLLPETGTERRTGAGRHELPQTAKLPAATLPHCHTACRTRVRSWLGAACVVQTWRRIPCPRQSRRWIRSRHRLAAVRSRLYPACWHAAFPHSLTRRVKTQRRRGRHGGQHDSVRRYGTSMPAPPNV